MKTRTIHFAALLFSLSLMLPACTTGDTPTDVPFYTATPRFVPNDAQQSESDGQGDLLSGISGGEPLVLAQQGDFHISVTGDVTATSSKGSIVYNYVAATGSLPDRDTIFITATDATTSQQVTFEFPPGLEPGTYTLTDPGSTLPGLARTQYLRFGDTPQASSRSIQAYNQNVSGKLVLLETGALISGVFEFSADWVTGDSSGETVTRSVVVRGEFTDVPYLRRNDPFDTDLPVLERATIPAEEAQRGP